MTPKRSLSPADAADTPDPKRQRVDEANNDNETPDQPVAQDRESESDDYEEEDRAVESSTPTQHHAARRGIQRSIALVLKHDGFQSAKPDALESFTQMVETCSSIPEADERALFAGRRR